MRVSKPLRVFDYLIKCVQYLRYSTRTGLLQNKSHWVSSRCIEEVSNLISHRYNEVLGTIQPTSQIKLPLNFKVWSTVPLLVIYCFKFQFIVLICTQNISVFSMHCLGLRGSWKQIFKLGPYAWWLSFIISKEIN